MRIFLFCSLSVFVSVIIVSNCFSNFPTKEDYRPVKQQEVSMDKTTELKNVTFKSIDLENMSVADVKTYLSKIVEDIPAPYRDSAYIEFYKHGYYEGYFVSYRRPYENGEK